MVVVVSFNYLSKDGSKVDRRRTLELFRYMEKSTLECSSIRFVDIYPNVLTVGDPVVVDGKQYTRDKQCLLIDNVQTPVCNKLQLTQSVCFIDFADNISFVNAIDFMHVISSYIVANKRLCY
jgi:hypothetical protein